MKTFGFMDFMLIVSALKDHVIGKITGREIKIAIRQKTVVMADEMTVVFMHYV
jgi:hypothetical protein